MAGTGSAPRGAGVVGRCSLTMRVELTGEENAPEASRVAAVGTGGAMVGVPEVGVPEVGATEAGFFGVAAFCASDSDERDCVEEVGGVE